MAAACGLVAGRLGWPRSSGGVDWSGASPAGSAPAAGFSDARRRRWDLGLGLGRCLGHVGRRLGPAAARMALAPVVRARPRRPAPRSGAPRSLQRPVAARAPGCLARRGRRAVARRRARRGVPAPVGAAPARGRVRAPLAGVPPVGLRQPPLPPRRRVPRPPPQRAPPPRGARRSSASRRARSSASRRARSSASARRRSCSAR